MGKLARNKELIRIVENDGWVFVRQRGSHRQYTHPTKPGKITIPATKISRNIELSAMRQAGLR